MDSVTWGWINPAWHNNQNIFYADFRFYFKIECVRNDAFTYFKTQPTDITALPNGLKLPGGDH